MCVGERRESRLLNPSPGSTDPERFAILRDCRERESRLLNPPPGVLSGLAACKTLGIPSKAWFLLDARQ